MIKELEGTQEVHELAGTLGASFIQRRDLYPRQLEDGSYVCIRKPLLERHLIAHLKGKITLGIYLLDQDNHSRFVVIDADDDLQLARLANIAMSLAQQQVPSYLETSRRGGHLWFFFERPMPGRDARSFGIGLLKSYDMKNIELYPKQDKLEDGPGSLIRLPFGVHRKTGLRYGFILPNGKPLADSLAEQIRVLANPLHVPQAALERFMMLGKAAAQKSALRTSEGVGDPLSERIKSSVTVLEFVSQYVELSSNGRGLCPFHDDKHASFSVNAKQNYWYCFAGCGGGSIIDFWMKYKNVDFKQAVHELAEMVLKD